MIERRPRQFLAVWSDDGQSVKGSTFEEALYVDGVFWKNEVTTVPPEQFAEFGELFSSALQSQLEQLVEAHTTAINLKQAALNTANATIAELESDLSIAASQLESVTLAKQALEAQLDAILNPPGPDVTTVSGLREYIATTRYNHEVEGFMVGDQFVSTNRDELAHWFARFYDAFNWLSGNEIARAINPSGLYPYKPKGGTKVAMLTAQEAVRAYQCLAWYVNACIATEGGLIEQIEAGTRLDLILNAANNAATWPQKRFAWNPS